MRAEEDRRAPLPRDRAHVAEDLALPGRIEAERRLVQEDDRGIVDERARDPEPLAHPAAVCRDRRARAIGEPHLLEQRARDGARAAREMAVEPGVVAQILAPVWPPG